MTREEIIAHMNVMAQNSLSGGMLYVMTEKDLEVVRDAAALLKEQEAVEPKRNVNWIGERRCGNCNREIDKYDGIKFCPACGRAVKWE